MSAPHHTSTRTGDWTSGARTADLLPMTEALTSFTQPQPNHKASGMVPPQSRSWGAIGGHFRPGKSTVRVAKKALDLEPRYGIEP